MSVLREGKRKDTQNKYNDFIFSSRRSLKLMIGTHLVCFFESWRTFSSSRSLTLKCRDARFIGSNWIDCLALATTLFYLNALCYLGITSWRRLFFFAVSQLFNDDAHLGALIKPSPYLCSFTRDTFLPRKWSRNHLHFCKFFSRCGL